MFGGLVTFRQLKWFALVAPIVFLAVMEYVRWVLHPYLLTWQGRLLINGALVVAIVFFWAAVFTVLTHLRQRLQRQNEELKALHMAGLDIYRELSLDSVLQKVVDQARHLVGARYGALSVVDREHRIQAFVTSGITDEQRRKIGELPHGRGLLGVVLHEGQRLRIPNIQEDSRSVGFPPHHPQMHSLLAVPVNCKGPFRGNLYLAEKEDEPEFSEEDEETLVRFAVQAAIAIDNAYLHQRVQELAVAEERLRLAREMHDGMAQVLAYVNTKAQAVTEYLRNDRSQEAAHQLDELASAARGLLVDVREGILGLRTGSSTEKSLAESLREYLERWREQSGIEGKLEIRGAPVLPPQVEFQAVRIIQEALANVRKHARARRALVRLEERDGATRVLVEDDGVGFDPGRVGAEGSTGFGLATMRERAESVGASLEVQSNPGGPTRIVLEFSR